MKDIEEKDRLIEECDEQLLDFNEQKLYIKQSLKALLVDYKLLPEDEEDSFDKKDTKSDPKNQALKEKILSNLNELSQSQDLTEFSDFDFDIWINKIKGVLEMLVECQSNLAIKCREIEVLQNEKENLEEFQDKFNKQTEQLEYLTSHIEGINAENKKILDQNKELEEGQVVLEDKFNILKNEHSKIEELNHTSQEMIEKLEENKLDYEKKMSNAEIKLDKYKSQLRETKANSEQINEELQNKIISQKQK